MGEVLDLLTYGKDQVMTTSTQEKEIVSVTLDATLFHDLLAGAMTHSGKDDTLPRLFGVYLGRREGKVIAFATDRYRLIEGSLDSEGEGEGALVRLALPDVKALAIALNKAKRWEKISLTIAGNIVSVSVSGSTYTYTAHLDEHPPYSHLFEVSGDPVAFPAFSINPSFFADYGKIAGKKGQVIVRQYGENKPYHVDMPDASISWKALLMPMRVK